MPSKGARERAKKVNEENRRKKIVEVSILTGRTVAKVTLTLR
jgi:hypothetical protein